MHWAKQSDAVSYVIGPILDAAGVEYTGAVIGDLSLSKNGGTLTALASAATLTHISNGLYTLALTTNNTDTLGTARVFCTKATYQMPPLALMVLPATVYDALTTNAVGAAGGFGTSTLTQTQVTGGTYAINSASFAFNAALDFTTTQKSATLARVTLVDTVTTYTGNTPQTGDAYARLGAPAGASIAADIATRLAPTVAGRTLDVTATGAAGVDWANVESPTASNNLSGTTVGFVSTVGNVSSIEPAAMTQCGLVVEHGDVTASTATTVSFNPLNGSGPDTLVGSTVVVTRDDQIGAAGQARLITGVSGTVGGGPYVLTVDRAWSLNPDPAFPDKVVVIPTAAAAALRSWNGTTPNDLISGRVDANTQATAATLTYNLAGSVTSVTNRVTANTDQLAGQTVTAASGVTFPSSVGTSTLTQTQVTGGTYAINSSSFAFNSALDFTTTQKASTLARVTLVDTVTTYTGNTPQTGDAYARLGAPAGASVSADVAAVKTDTANLLTRITSTLFSGITSLAQWLGLLAGKQSGNSTARTELRATGAGSGTYDETTDSQEAIRDRGDTAWTTATGFSTLTSGDVSAAVWNAATASYGTAGTYGLLLETNLDAAVTSRMATYTQPTGFLAATFPSVVASTTNITAGTITTATNVTTVNGLAAGVITATSIAADAITAAKIADGAIDTATFASGTTLPRVTLVDTVTTNTDMLTAAAVWAAGTRTLTAGTNIVLAKGVGVTGFNDLSAAQVNAEADTALADVGLTTTVTGRIDAAVSSRQASGSAVTLPANPPVGFLVTASYDTPPAWYSSPVDVSANVSAIKAKTDNLPADPAGLASLALAHGAGSWLTATGFAVPGDAMTLTGDAAAAVVAAVDAAVTTSHGAGSYVRNTEPANPTDYARNNVAPSWYSTPLDATGTRTSIGMAAANLDAQLAAIAGFIDTEVGAVKTVTDRLNTTIELDGSVYRFTTEALEQAPTGGGGGSSITAQDVWEYTTRTLTSASGPTAAQIADAVWDEDLSDHTGTGSAGDKLTTAAAGGSSGGMTTETVLLTITTPSAGLVDDGGNQLTEITVGQALTALLVTLIGDRAGVGTRKITASLPGVLGATVAAERISRTDISAEIVLPAAGG